ncbi:cytochrome c [Flavobacteriales bacterium]|nr:cytochrome c [Flavobacteriales bacterium]
MRLKTKIFLFTVLSLIGYFVLTAFVKEAKEIRTTEYINDVINKLGGEMPLHFIASNQLDSNKVKMGYNLVNTGYMNSKSKKQSKHFVCTDCHNVGREDPDLTKNNPDTRLNYVAEKNMNFLPGTTLFGQVNKRHWYNEDYFKKYGELVVPARDTLENAIQLCATVCSQGRELEKDEMEAVMHYLNSIGYTVEDINLTDFEKSIISRTIEMPGSKKDMEDAIRIIKSKYLDYSPATFMEPMALDKRRKSIYPNPFNGKKIYELSCLTCHKEGGVTNYKLSNEKLTFKHLDYWSNTHKVFSVYDITRKGTYSKNGYKPYMPNFTKERMSDRQLEDLMEFIRQKSEGMKLRQFVGTPSF